MTSHDPTKSRRNLRKRGIGLPGCVDAFDAPMLTYEDTAITASDASPAFGWAHERVVVLRWADREDGPRLISCREANRRECQNYFKAFPPH